MNGIIKQSGCKDIYKQIEGITKWKEISPLEFLIANYTQDESCKWDEINQCSICMCELWDNIQDSADLGD